MMTHYLAYLAGLATTVIVCGADLNSDATGKLMTAGIAAAVVTAIFEPKG